MRTLLVGEGIHELGDNENMGALTMLVGRLAQTVRIDAVRPWKDGSIGRLHGTGSGFHKRALRWMIQARKEGFDALVLLVDEDDDRSRFRQLTRAQEVLDPELLRALGVAVRTFDAWMLADETALTRVIGRNVQTQPAPEGIAAPKAHIRELVGGTPGEDALRRLYAQIARQVEINVLEHRCPRASPPSPDAFARWRLNRYRPGPPL